ncbi:MAG TPA: polysaccharide deacetylase family protein [Bacteroidales bacterium]|nr:polysaccharide deacetylase family protein [Bacteroidales bacterium]
MPGFRNVLMPLATSFSLDKMIRRTGKSVVFPFYHMVSDTPPPHIKHLYRVKSVAEFRTDLDDLLKYFAPLSPEWLLNPRPSTGKGKPAFILSFDDGLHEVSDIIVPVLEAKGINAVFFLNNNFIGNNALFYRYKVSLLIERIRTGHLSDDVLLDVAASMDQREHDQDSLVRGLLSLGYKCSRLISRIARRTDVDFEQYLDDHKPYLDEKEIRSLQKKGFYIGAHSHDHPLFHQLDPEEQYEEVRSSMAGIREKFETGYSFFSFPFSDTGVSRTVLQRLYETPGSVLDASFGTSGLKADEPFPHYQRIPLEKSPARAEKYLKTEFLFYRMKAIAGRNKVKRRV